LTIGLPYGLATSLNYILYTSPNGAFSTVQQFDWGISLDDSEWLGAFALNPGVIFSFELDNTSFGDDEGGYFELNLEPGFDLELSKDYPLTFSVQMTPAVIRRIVVDNPSCVMLKHEDWPGLEKISALRGFERDGSMRHISILCGNGGLFLDFECERGADGAMTGYAFPDMLCDVVRLQREGRRDAAHDLFDAHLPLLRYEQQPGVGLGVRKHVLQRRGLIASAAQRAPKAALSDATRAEVEYLLARLARHDIRAALPPL